MQNEKLFGTIHCYSFCCFYSFCLFFFSASHILHWIFNFNVNFWCHRQTLSHAHIHLLLPLTRSHSISFLGKTIIRWILLIEFSRDPVEIHSIIPIRVCILLFPSHALTCSQTNIHQVTLVSIFLSHNLTHRLLWLVLFLFCCVVLCCEREREYTFLF